MATQACLAATVKYNALLGNFLDLMVREHVARFAHTLCSPMYDTVSVKYRELTISGHS